MERDLHHHRRTVTRCGSVAHSAVYVNGINWSKELADNVVKFRACVTGPAKRSSGGCPRLVAVLHSSLRKLVMISNSRRPRSTGICLDCGSCVYRRAEARDGRWERGSQGAHRADRRRKRGHIYGAPESMLLQCRTGLFLSQGALDQIYAAPGQLADCAEARRGHGTSR